MEFNVVDTNRIQESLDGPIFGESLQLDSRNDENWYADERYSTSVESVSYCYQESDYNQDIIVANTEMVSNDIEIIAIDPNGEYNTDDDDDDDENGNEDDDEEAELSSVFEDDSTMEDHGDQTVTIESVKAALQQSDHHRIYRKSISLPHSPTHYSLDLSGISLDDLDLQSHLPDVNMGHLIENEVVKTFDLASYITQDDNFEVISPAKILPNISSNVNITINSLPMLHKQMENVELSSLNSGNNNINKNNGNVINARRCVISTKKMHYEVPSPGSSSNSNKNNNNNSSSSSGSSSSSDSDDELSNSSYTDETNDCDAAKNDNPKVDPTWCPAKNTRAQNKKIPVSKLSKKVKPKLEKNVKRTPVKASCKSSSVSFKPQHKNLLKACKSTSRTGILNAGKQLTKDKVHKITKSPAGKMIKLDHDYCTVKGKSESIFKTGPQRKAIEIPIMDPTFDRKINRLFKNCKAEKRTTIEIAEKLSPNKSIDCTSLVVPKEPISLLKARENNQKMEKNNKDVVVEEKNEINVQNQNKRKLNIAEYMKRREISSTLGGLESSSKNSKTSHAPIVDPILAAKHKVLRMQELKKEAKLKEAEPNLKNMPLLPILPLAEITGTKEDNEELKPVKALIHPDYEEIIIVSMSSNTDITIPPSAKADNLLSYINDTIKKVQTQDCRVVLNSSSLIVSIQDVVLKKTNVGIQDIEMVSSDHEKTQTEETLEEKEHKDSIKEHGEDKIIMHLRKDRKKPECCSIGVQTLDIPSFSTLRKFAAKIEDVFEKENRSRRARSNIRKSRSRSSHRNARNNSDSCQRSIRDRSRSPYHNRRSREKSRSSIERTISIERYNSRSRTMSGNSSSSASSSSSSSSSGSDKSYRRSDSNRSRRNRERRCYNSASSRHSSSSYSSRSRSRESIRFNHLSRDMEHINKKREDPEKRNIVYVGQIEETMTKDNLRKKFVKYGIVKNISLHHKENGMRYGFVTFNKPEEAYSAIDSSNTDENISMYDISFGGRRAFCKAQYADLDGINNYINYHDIGYHPIEPYVQAPPIRHEEPSESFEDMLKKLKQSISARKPTREFNA